MILKKDGVLQFHCKIRGTQCPPDYELAQDKVWAQHIENKNYALITFECRLDARPVVVLNQDGTMSRGKHLEKFRQTMRTQEMPFYYTPKYANAHRAPASTMPNIPEFVIGDGLRVKRRLHVVFLERWLDSSLRWVAILEVLP